MSKANGAIEKKDTFLQHVSLKNYKSIKDVEIDFKPGLNVIIGKNASGKTNFIMALDKVLTHKYTDILASEFAIKVNFNDDNVTIKKETNPGIPIEIFKINQHTLLRNNEINIEVNGEKVNEKNMGVYSSPIYTLAERNFYFDKVLVTYGITYKNTDPLINLPLSFSIIDGGVFSKDLIFYILSDGQTKLINSFFERFNKFLIETYGNDKLLLSEDLKNRISTFSKEYFDSINIAISLYSPIGSVRINDDFNIITDTENLKQTITNLYLEFLINESWLPFNLLSDGTKRLFYIISETLSTYNDKESLYNNDLNIVLLEEPELGIHPHQLHQLMQFIKEQSKEKQIILTTHSPQVLDALEPDELDRIIICHSDPKNGTQLSHLSDQQIKKAKKYMASEAFLSDYWRFSDLEPA